MPKFRVTLREARWHRVTFDCEADTIEEVESDPGSFEPTDAKWITGDDVGNLYSCSVIPFTKKEN